ncbi:MAG: cupin [Candidatus Tantalella remota]|nr:cupin [Candidatus Tantalella remota]
MKNIFKDIPKELKEELFETILDGDRVRIERIVSEGQATPAGEWIQQEEAEWVILLSEEAELSFDDGAPNEKMLPGDYIFIEAGRRHRVEWTSRDKQTVWLAVHRTA